ncbi:hypothetical protein [Roseomonas sp. BN140053]|uniref:hypothetical protein n=1 Tax=Roseomonas sp. BN140053 TaxID=3391898 RepID=UPI0039EA44DA
MPTLQEFWDPNEWELHAFGLLQDRHGATNVMKVPARHKGDFGIDYYCVSGRVAYQCYAVQEPVEVDDRATKQKAKITKDLNKFCSRAEVAKLFVSSEVERWILVVPIHDSAQVNLHLSAKTKHVRSLNLSYVAPDFEVLVHDLEGFDPTSVATRAFHRQQISLPPQPATAAQISSWTQASNPLVSDLSRKLTKRIGPRDPAKLDAAVQDMVGLFLEKENTLDSLRRDAPHLHEALAAVISRHATRLSFYGSPEDATPYYILRSEVESLTAELKQSVPNFSDGSAQQIALGAIAEWLLRCPLDFPPYGHAA